MTDISGTLAAINPCINASGTYADPDNDFGAVGWWKLGMTSSGTLDATNYGTSGSAFDGTPGDNTKGGFCIMSGSGTVIGNQGNGGRPPIPAGGATLTNFYSSGTVDYKIYSGNIADQNPIDGGTTFVNNKLITKGTVVLD